MRTATQYAIKKNLGLEIKTFLNDVVASIENEKRMNAFRAKNVFESIERYKQLKVKISFTKSLRNSHGRCTNLITLNWNK